MVSGKVLSKLDDPPKTSVIGRGGNKERVSDTLGSFLSERQTGLGPSLQQEQRFETCSHAGQRRVHRHAWIYLFGEETLKGKRRGELFYYETLGI